MSAVDVLAVMDFLTGRYIANKGTDSQFISCITPQCFGTDANLRESEYGAAWLDLAEARAAVAELIEASADLAKAVREETAYLATTPYRALSSREMEAFDNRVIECTTRLDAALARITGEGA
jgi:hypothetical protein